MIKFTKTTCMVSIKAEKGFNKKMVEGYNYTTNGLYFCIHRDVNGGKCWTATEVQTGMSVQTGCKTRVDAVEGIEMLIRLRGIETVKEAIENCLKKYNQIS